MQPVHWQGAGRSGQRASLIQYECFLELDVFWVSFLGKQLVGTLGTLV